MKVSFQHILLYLQLLLLIILIPHIHGALQKKTITNKLNPLPKAQVTHSTDKYLFLYKLLLTEQNKHQKTKKLATYKIIKKQYNDLQSNFDIIAQKADNKFSRQNNLPNIISVEISIGELIDKITILELKKKYFTDQEKLNNVSKELAILHNIQNTKLPKTKQLKKLTQQLYAVNKQLWDIEVACREKEQKQTFDNDFIQITRSVYKTNDKRCAIKKQINLLFNSNLIEEKSYM